MKHKTDFLKVITSFILVLVTLILFSTGVKANDDGSPSAYSFVPLRYEPSTLDDQHTVQQKARELYSYCKLVELYYSLGSEWSELIPADGEVEPGYINTKESADVLTSVYTSLFEVYGEDDFPENYDADNEFSMIYDRIKAAAERIELSDDDLLILINICSEETNDNGFYNDDVWQDYLYAVQQAQTAYDNGISVDNMNAFWDLYFAFNRLCVQYGEPGDIDGSGETEIVDVTYLQRALAGMDGPLHAAQKYAGCVQQPIWGYSDAEPEITDATVIQRYLANIPVQMYDNKISDELITVEQWKINSILETRLYRAWSPNPYD